MKKLNLSAIVALFLMSLALAACGPLPSHYDGHGNREDGLVP